MPPRHRLFIAIDPSRETTVAATRAIERLRAGGIEAAWGDAAHLHVTIHFLGDEVDDADLHRICVAMDEAAAAVRPFRVQFGGCGAFPTPQRPRVVWMGVREGEPDMVRLHDALAERLEPIGFPPEARGFRPHLTLGRCRGAGRDGTHMAEVLAACGDMPPSDTSVTRVCLYESHLSRSGAEHNRLHTSPLRGTD